MKKLACKRELRNLLTFEKNKARDTIFIFIDMLKYMPMYLG